MNWNKEIYKDINNLTNPEIIKSNWSRTGGTIRSPLHSIASYLAMFAPALPEYFIDKYSNEGDLVFDSFSGRGTTTLRSRELNRNFVGSDLNPYALVLTRFKISQLKKNKWIARLMFLQKQFIKNKKQWLQATYKKEYKELLYYYNRRTLSQLIFIREKIDNLLKNLNKIKDYLNDVDEEDKAKVNDVKNSIENIITAIDENKSFSNFKFRLIKLQDRINKLNNILGLQEFYNYLKPWYTSITQSITQIYGKGSK